jgi:hypothetical protein
MFKTSIHLLLSKPYPFNLHSLLTPYTHWKGILTIKLFVISPSLSPPIPSAFTPYPVFQCYPQNKKFLLNLSTKCWNSAFNMQDSRLIIVVVQIWAVKKYVAAMEALRKKERQDETQFNTKFGGKTSLGPSYWFCKTFVPSHTLDALLCWNWPFSPPNRVTLQITLMPLSQAWDKANKFILKTKKSSPMFQDLLSSPTNFPLMNVFLSYCFLRHLCDE